MTSTHDAAVRVLRQPACALLGCRYPLVVCGSGTPGQAAAWLAAVSQAGGFGLLAPAAAEPAALREALAPLGAAGAGFGLDLDQGQDQRLDLPRQLALLDLAAALRLPAVGLPADGAAALWARCAAAGLRVLCRVEAPAQAMAAQQAGASLLVAGDAGPARLSALLAAATVPVLAGLSGDPAETLASALALGAQGGVLAPATHDADALAARLDALLADAAARLGADLWPAPRPLLSSPVCYAEALARAHRDVMAHEAVLDALQTLLLAERAGARTALALLREAPPGTALAGTLQAVHRGEVRWCGMLMAAIRHLGAVPHARTGDFHAKVMAVPDLPGRLALLNRGQAWVVRRLEALAPRIDDELLREALEDMLSAHARNMALVEQQLA